MKGFRDLKSLFGRAASASGAGSTKYVTAGSTRGSSFGGLRGGPLAGTRIEGRRARVARSGFERQALSACLPKTLNPKRYWL